MIFQLWILTCFNSLYHNNFADLNNRSRAASSTVLQLSLSGTLLQILIIAYHAANCHYRVPCCKLSLSRTVLQIVINAYRFIVAYQAANCHHRVPCCKFELSHWDAMRIVQAFMRCHAYCASIHEMPCVLCKHSWDAMCGMRCNVRHEMQCAAWDAMCGMRCHVRHEMPCATSFDVITALVFTWPSSDTHGTRLVIIGSTQRTCFHKF